MLPLRLLHLLLRVAFVLQEGVEYLLRVVLAHLFVLLFLLLRLVLALVFLLLLLLLFLLLLLLLLLVLLLILLLLLLILEQFLRQRQVVPRLVVLRVQAQRLLVGLHALGVILALHLDVTEVVIDLR